MNCCHNDELFSFRVGGVHTLLCDGHVQLLSDRIDYKVLRALVTRQGSEVVGEF